MSINKNRDSDFHSIKSNQYDRQKFEEQLDERLQNQDWDAMISGRVYGKTKSNWLKLGSVASVMILFIVSLFFLSNHFNGLEQKEIVELNPVIDIEWYSQIENDELELDSLLTTAAFVE